MFLGKSTLNMRARRLISLLIPAILVLNLSVGPLLQSNPPMPTEPNPTALITQTNPESAIEVVGLFGTNTLVNIIKGFFAATKPLADGLNELSICVTEWSVGGNIFVGVLICPAISVLGSVVGLLVLLYSGIFEVRIFTDPATATLMQSIHSQTTTLANSVFIILFLLIIFSMVSSIGISNYHIKKMAPRLMLVAVLVNTSFFISAVLVDFSNIAGGSIQGFMSQISENANIEYNCIATNPNNPAAVQACVAGGGAAPGAVREHQFSQMADNFNPLAEIGTIANAPLIATSVGIIVAVLVVMMIIAAVTIPILAALRMIILMFLVIASPLAFVAILHPKTQKFFSTWFKHFGQLLIIFPAFGLFVGLSEVAAMIFYRMPSAGLDPGPVIFKIVGTLVAMAAPVLLIKPLMKKTSSIMNAASQKVDGAIKTAAVIGAGAISMGAGAAVAGPGFAAKMMGAMKAGPGKIGKFGKSVEGFAEQGLKRGKNNFLTRGYSRSKAQEINDARRKNLELAKQSGDPALEHTAIMQEHKKQVDDHSLAMTGMTNDELQDEVMVMSPDRKTVQGMVPLTKNNAARQQAAWAEMSKRDQVGFDTSKPQDLMRMAIPEANMKGMDRVQRAAATQRNAAIADAAQGLYGDGLVTGGAKQAIINGQISTGEGLSNKLIENFDKMSQAAVGTDKKALSGIDRLAQGGNQDAKRSLSQVSQSMLDSNGEIRLDIKKDISNQNLKIIEKTLRGPAEPVQTTEAPASIDWSTAYQDDARRNFSSNQGGQQPPSNPNNQNGPNNRRGGS